MTFPDRAPQSYFYINVDVDGIYSYPLGWRLAEIFAKTDDRFVFSDYADQ